jgi:hypothetical protein
VRNRTIRSLQLAAQRPDTAADIRWRLDSRKAGDLANAETKAKYPTLDGENIGSALAYQEERYAFHMSQLSKQEAK